MMKHFTSLMGKKHMLLMLLMLLCSMRVAMAANQIITINVATPGTLNTMMGETKKYAITALKLTGSINIDDIKFLREMAGCYHNWGKYPGKLEYLDLEDVRLNFETWSSLDIYTNKREYWTTVTGKDAQTLPDYIFAYLDQLKTIILPSGIRNIGNSVFYRNTSLTTVKLPYNLRSIDGYAFLECENLTDLTIPTFVERIDEKAFYGCSSLTSIKIPSGVKTIEESTFENCSNLTTVSLPSSLTNVYNKAFQNDEKLENIEFPKSIEYINSNAFAGCSSLRTNYIGGNIKWIGSDAFKNCTSIQTMVIDPTDGGIDIAGFEGCTNLESVTINNIVNNISAAAFKGCSKLRSFTVEGYGNKLAIGKSAFEGCSSLKQFDFPTTETTIGDRAFCGCKYLKEVVISSDYITEIPTEAFADSGVDKIKLPANLERIGERAFIGAGRLGATEGFTIPSKVKEIGAEAFYKGFGYAAYLVLPASLKTVPIYAFAACHANVIYAYMSEPFALGDDDFDGYPRSECKLYVPKGCAKKYRQAEIWKEFDIEEMDGTGIEGVTNDSTVTEVSRYDANGNKLAAPAKGLNIVRYSDGTVKKVMVE